MGGFGCRLSWVSRPTLLALVVITLSSLSVIGCRTTPFTLAAAGPYLYPQNWAYPADINPTLDRVAVVVTITNRSGDDLEVNPADFLVRDGQHHVFTADLAATTAATSIQNEPAQLHGSLPLTTLTLRNDDILSGIVVFDLPNGDQPVELIWRQSDTDSVATLAATR